MIGDHDQQQAQARQEAAHHNQAHQSVSSKDFFISFKNHFAKIYYSLKILQF
jgi:hypothetical protein